MEDRKSDPKFGSDPIPRESPSKLLVEIVVPRLDPSLIGVAPEVGPSKVGSHLSSRSPGLRGNPHWCERRLG